MEQGLIMGTAISRFASETVAMPCRDGGVRLLDLGFVNWCVRIVPRSRNNFYLAINIKIFCFLNQAAPVV